MTQEEVQSFGDSAARVAGFEGFDRLTVDGDGMAWVHWRDRKAPVGMAPEGLAAATLGD